MLFGDYKRNFDLQRAKVALPIDVVQKGFGCKTSANPSMPPWVMDWAVLFGDGTHFRVKETYKPAPHPFTSHGERLHFSFHYGATTGTDAKGMPKTISGIDTIIRLDKDQFGPHMHYAGMNHIQQASITGKFRINNAEVFDFVDAVLTHRMSGAPFGDILFFGLPRSKRR